MEWMTYKGDKNSNEKENGTRNRGLEEGMLIGIHPF